MMKLPNEILTIILSTVPFKYRIVCRIWKDIIYDKTPMDVIQMMHKLEEHKHLTVYDVMSEYIGDGNMSIRSGRLRIRHTCGCDEYVDVNEFLEYGCICSRCKEQLHTPACILNVKIYRILSKFRNKPPKAKHSLWQFIEKLIP